ncbi:hypothetical protein [Nocardia sp. NBC_01388]|uniref:hypothetical protein n=1 Tax=Nocardia sp. NBC_01388 TaxID=2903596 RepID=UPI0032438D01
MKRSAILATATIAAALALPLATAASAQAAPEGSMYFSYGDRNCAIMPDGTIGCDLNSIQMVNLPVGPWGIAVPTIQYVADPNPRATYDFSRPYTQPGGNPDLSQVANDNGPFGPRLSYAGAYCEAGFHGILHCVARGGDR